MKRVAILVAASPTSAFYSQIAALKVALLRLPWSRWQPSLHVYLGGPRESGALQRWTEHLGDAEMHWTTADKYARDGDWAQSDDVLAYAPPNADVLLAMDADTFPVGDIEPVLEQVDRCGAIAGVIAHYPPFPTLDGRVSVREEWRRLAQGFLDAPLDCSYSHSLAGRDVEAEQRAAPFYLNFGVVFFPRDGFRAIASRYLAIRPGLMSRMANPDFSGQAALTLAIASARAKTWALPMRYNFPNDPIAERLYPGELHHAAVFHYLRTDFFDRHRIFVSPVEYANFQALPLEGVNRHFQQAVRTTIGERYPFE